MPSVSIASGSYPSAGADLHFLFQIEFFPAFCSRNRCNWFSIENNLGKVVYLETGPDNTFPNPLVWYGTNNTDNPGEKVLDGEYFYTFSVTDSQGRTLSTDPEQITVDSADEIIKVVTFHKIVDNGIYNLQPSWRTDGNSIAFLMSFGGCADDGAYKISPNCYIWQISPAGTGLELLLEKEPDPGPQPFPPDPFKVNTRQPVYSPDGSLMVFIRDSKLWYLVTETKNYAHPSPLRRLRTKPINRPSAGNPKF